MKLRLLFFVITLCLGCHPPPVYAGGYYLLEAKGIAKQLEINQYFQGNDGWRRFDTGISYQLRNNKVILIVCNNGCVTSHDITIGSTKNEVFWKYGPPKNTERLNDNELLIYKGVTFEVNTAQQVTSILISQ